MILNSLTMLVFFRISIVFFSCKFCHLFILYEEKNIYIFEKIDNVNNSDICVTVIYFIVHFNA